MKTACFFRLAFFTLLAFVVTATTSQISFADEEGKAADVKEAKPANYDEKLSASKTDTHLYELRVYTIADGEGVRDKFHKVVKDKAMKLFDKHGMKSVGYWDPADPKSNKFYYMLVFENREAREKAWKEFKADPDWINDVSKDFIVDGKNIAPESQVFFLHATDYSPTIEIKAGTKPRVFELRTYTTNDGRLQNLHDRFRVHTKSLFERHGMTNIGYWQMDSKQIKNKTQLPQNDPANTLIYLLAHDSEDTKTASFKAFVSDPNWKMIVQDSEKRAGGSLTVKGGVKSLMLNATDYSPLK